ncbi:calcium-binding protein [Pseudotabrizicola sediminis]|uniref:Calcium-binding protein n=1 Tax=Pseudotabrizicola sediminis TaxID=2486418 RepID=A0ABY2KJD4_9RHOB|nr:calcium-binding protein [Pseudotabrizicola sediminis]TGD42060.1 calcium-binding protein [Pseudotabrizicola sediminis]
MIDKTKIVGASLVALAIALTAGAAMADRGDRVGGMVDQMGEMGGAFDFAAMDADGDGKVTQAEIDAFRAAQTAAIDTDGDGLLSAEEIAAMHIRAATKRANDRAARMIERLDTDGDGKLSAAEMMARPMPARMFERLDADNDGAITEAEIAATKERMGERRGGRHGDQHRGPHGPRGNN